jgi:hypothetical protein
MSRLSRNPETAQCTQVEKRHGDVSCKAWNVVDYEVHFHVQEDVGTVV